MLSVRNLSKKWAEFSLKNINLDVRDREYFVVLGPTGSGKTLLLELIAGFHRPDKGEIWMDGQNLTDLPPEKRTVGFVFQDYSLFPHLTVEENIGFGLRLRKIPRSEARKKIQQIMRALNISGLAKRYPKTLSGGERQKTALARALVLKPRVLLMDEPLSAVDALARERLRDELKIIHNEFGATTIHVTHDHEEAILLGDRIGVMNNGQIIQVGDPNEIFRRPKSEFIASFMGVENIFRGKSKVKGGVARIDIGNGVEVEAVSEKTGEVKACVRPEEIIVSKRPVRSSGRNVLKGRISEISNRGPTVWLRIDVGREFTAVITKKSFMDMNLKVGTGVYLAFKASSVHVI